MSINYYGKIKKKNILLITNVSQHAGQTKTGRGWPAC